MGENTLYRFLTGPSLHVAAVALWAAVLVVCTANSLWIEANKKREKKKERRKESVPIIQSVCTI
jgi:hypothetical protein